MSVRFAFHVLIIAFLFGMAYRARAAAAVTPPFLSNSTSIYAPADSLADTARTTDHRWRFQIGTALVSLEKEDPVGIPSLNINHRWSWIFGKPGLTVAPICEAGIDMIFPYAKGGVEIRHDKFFLDAHGGFGMIFIPIMARDFRAPPFYGACCGYMLATGDRRAEIEAGINVISADVRIIVPYVTFGFVW